MRLIARKYGSEPLLSKGAGNHKVHAHAFCGSAVAVRPPKSGYSIYIS